MPSYKNPGLIRFKGKLEQSSTSGAGAWIIFPKSVEKCFGVKGRVPIQATFDGIPYRGSLVKMGGKDHRLLVLKEIRESIGKQKGDSVTVTVHLDEQPRLISLAADARKALRTKPKAQAAWKSLSYSHQREYFQWIEGAKQTETRTRRIAEMVKEFLAMPVRKKS